VVLAPEGRERSFNRGDYLRLIELLTGERDDALALLDKAAMMFYPWLTSSFE
jgi:hypothetical protein